MNFDPGHEDPRQPVDRVRWQRGMFIDTFKNGLRIDFIDKLELQFSLKNPSPENSKWFSGWLSDDARNKIECIEMTDKAILTMMGIRHGE
jgi:hypothetical protein